MTTRDDQSLDASAPPSPPVSRNCPAQEPPPGSAVEFSHYFCFTTELGFSCFWWMQDSYSGVQDNLSCVLHGLRYLKMLHFLQSDSQ